MWRQKSRELWLKAEDRNSRFFHASTFTNRRRIFIPTIKDDCGNWMASRQDIGKCLTDHFEALFQTEEVEHCSVLDSLIHPVISFHENNCFMAIPSGEKIFVVVRNMHPIKASGPDGMSAIFYQKYWCTIRVDVIQLVQNAFGSGIIPSSINDTAIVLIPKVRQVIAFKH